MGATQGYAVVAMLMGALLVVYCAVTVKIGGIVAGVVLVAAGWLMYKLAGRLLD